MTQSIAQPHVHPELISAQERVYRPCSMACESLLPEAESADYGAYSFLLNGLRIRFRVANITPTKVGQFVTLWQRVGTGPIQPFDMADAVDCFVVAVRSGAHAGQFVFPKAVLRQHDVVSLAGQGGKRAMRVYPPWDVTTSRQALKTQQWQLEYFLDVSDAQPMDTQRALDLYAAAQPRV